MIYKPQYIIDYGYLSNKDQDIFVDIEIKYQRENTNFLFILLGQEKVTEGGLIIRETDKRLDISIAGTDYGCYYDNGVAQEMYKLLGKRLDMGEFCMSYEQFLKERHIREII